MSKKNLIIIVIAIVLIIIGIIVLKNNNNDKKGNEVNNEQKIEVVESPIAQKKTNGTYELFNTDLKVTKGSTKIITTIKNVSSNKTEEQIIEIALLDKNNSELGTIKMAVPSLNSNDATEVSAEILQVYEGVNDFKIK